MKSIMMNLQQNSLERAKNLPYGDPLNPKTVIGPLINQTQLDKAIKNIEKAKKAGVDILLEGKVEGIL